MFGNMMERMEAMQEEMKAKLRATEVEASAGSGQVSVRMNCAREVLAITIAPALLAQADPEALEDFLIIAMNEALAKAAAEEASQGQNMLQNMLPGGLGGLMGA